MQKKTVCLAVLVTGIASAAFAEDQIFFELNAGAYWYFGLGAKIGWMHYWTNEKVGFIADVSYYNNGVVSSTIDGEHTRDWKEEIKRAHNAGIAAGVVFNNMGMNGVFRTSEYIKLKAEYTTTFGDERVIYPFSDIGFKLNVFFTDKAAFSAGAGAEIAGIIMLPFPYISLGMTFTL